MHYQTSFTLDRAHATECFEESESVKVKKNRYLKAVVFAVAAIGLFVANIDDHIAFIIALLAIVEAASVYYRRGWWVIRQMLGNSANTEVGIVIDDSGIHIKSVQVENDILWDNITALTETSRGYILALDSGGQSYLSKSILDADVTAYMLAKVG